MKTIFCVIISVLISLMSGCSNADSESVMPDSESVMPDVESDMSDVVSESDMFDIEFSDMPDIVFEVCTRYYRNNNYDMCSLTFVDKNGNFYSSDDSEINSLTNAELIEALRLGDERITKLPKSCDTDELLENYKKFLKVTANKEYGMAYSMEGIPAAESDCITWYGLYYDKDGKLVSLPIHKYRNFTEFNANDDRANEIFEWYSSAAKTQ